MSECYDKRYTLEDIWTNIWEEMGYKMHLIALEIQVKLFDANRYELQKKRVIRNDDVISFLFQHKSNNLYLKLGTSKT